jgi:hypothetical protein
MPTYTFRKPSDGTQISKRLTFAEYESVKAGENVIEDETGEVLEIVFNPGQVGFVMKDGESGGWTSKADKENRFRRVRSAQMARREKDHVFKSRLVPNYKGQEAHCWADVQDHVRSTSGVEAARTYNSHVARERSNS